MPDLILRYEGGAYELIIPNVEGPDAAILLRLGTQDNEAMAVRLLAESMKGGVPEIVTNSEFIFSNGQVTAAQVDAIFSSGDSLLFMEETAVGIFEAEVGETLLDALELAGEALAEFALTL